MVNNCTNTIARKAQVKLVYNLKKYFLKAIYHQDMTSSKEEIHQKLYLYMSHTKYDVVKYLWMATKIPLQWADSAHIASKFTTS